MAIARGGPFAQLVHHKSRTLSLVDELEGAAAAELAARDAAASRVESYAARAEAMHKRLHNRSASQAADWLRASVKKASDGGNKVQARHLVENETKRVRSALEAMAAWLDGDAKKRIVALPARFDALSKRALMHATSQLLPQVAGATRHRHSTARELSAHLARALDVQHVAEVDGLHAALEKLSVDLQPRESMPIDEHTQLLSAELWFRQRAQLASLHSLEHAAIPAVVRTFIDTLSGPSSVEDSAIARMRVGAAELRAAESFCVMMHGQASLQQQLDELHDVSRAARQGITSLSTHIQNGGGGSDSSKATYLNLWRSVRALSTQAAACQGAIREAVDVTAEHLNDFEGRELPRASAMLEAATTIGKAAAAIVGTLSGEVPPSGEVMALAPASADGGCSTSGPAGAPEPSVSSPTASALSVDGASSPPPPEVSDVVDRWGPTAVSIQAEQQKLVAAAADIEQHALDMQGLMLEIAAPIEGVMGRFLKLVHPNRELARKPGFKGLMQQCKVYEGCVDELGQRALAPLALPEVFARMHGQLQQQKDALNAWCYPLLKLKQELDLSEAPQPATSTIANRGGKVNGPAKVEPMASPVDAKAAAAATKGAAAKGALRPPKPGGAPGPSRTGSAPGSTRTTPRIAPSPAAMRSASPGTMLPRAPPLLPPSPLARRGSESGWAWSGGQSDMLDPAIVSRVSLDLMKTLLGSAEMKTAQRIAHESIVKRRTQAANIVEKRRGEQQKLMAELQALEQLLELSLIADAKGVPQASVEERVAILSEGVSAAEALAPSVDESRGKAVKKAAAAEAERKAAEGDKGVTPDKPKAAAAKTPAAKATPAAKPGAKPPAKKGKGAKASPAKEIPPPPNEEDLEREAAAIKVQAAVRGHQTKVAAQYQRNAATRMQAMMRGRNARRNSAELLIIPPELIANATGTPPEAAKKAPKGRDKSPVGASTAATPGEGKGAKAAGGKAGKGGKATPDAKATGSGKAAGAKKTPNTKTKAGAEGGAKRATTPAKEKPTGSASKGSSKMTPAKPLAGAGKAALRA